jgi:hypothetical protein
VRFSAGDVTNARGSTVLVPYLFTYSEAGNPRPFSGAQVQHLDAEAPRVSCEARFPAEAFELPSFRENLEFRMNILVISHYRGQEMFWSEGTAHDTFHSPEGWRRVKLGGE